MLTTCINNKSVHSVGPGYAEQGLQEKLCKAEQDFSHNCGFELKIPKINNEKIKIKRQWLRLWDLLEIPGHSWLSGSPTDVPGEHPSHRP